MNQTSTRLGLVALGAVLLVGLLALAGRQNEHPDNKQAVYDALHRHDLSTIDVFQHRRKGEITLRGIVAGPDLKASAETLTQQAAPGYTIKNQIQVQSAGLEDLEKSAQKNANANLDSAIEDRFKASIENSKKLENQKIQYSADNGTLYLKGTVNSEKEKQEVEELARKVPQVQHVVNDIAVKAS
jgi:hyperosmotically inducible periplasmic protein